MSIPRVTLDNRPTTDPIDTENQARQIFGGIGWFRMLGIKDHWPISDDVAIDLLTVAGEYDIDAKGLLDLIERRIVPAPAIDEDGQHEWAAGDLLLATQALEARQQWRMTPSRHDPKKHVFTIGLERARQDGTVAELVAGDGTTVNYDVHGLLVALVACQHHEGRQQIAALLRATLEAEHGVRV